MWIWRDENDQSKGINKYMCALLEHDRLGNEHPEPDFETSEQRWGDWEQLPQPQREGGNPERKQLQRASMWPAGPEVGAASTHL